MRHIHVVLEDQEAEALEKIKGERITTFLKKCYNLHPTSYNIIFTKNKE